MDATIYSSGVCYSSVCAHKDTTMLEITTFINEENPTGLAHDWELSDENFADGGANPGACDQDGERRHYLFSC